MPGFTNQYNTQNGMMGGQPMQNPPMPMGNPGAWQPQQPTMQQPSAPTFSPQPQPTQVPNDWRPYSPPNMLPAFNGKWVRGFEDIRPIDVPQDGSFTFFPQEDKSCIYAMTWGIDGRIQTFRFVPEKIEDQTPPSTMTDMSDPVKEILAGFTASMYNRMDALESRIGDILNRFEQPTATAVTKPKKTNPKDGDPT